MEVSIGVLIIGSLYWDDQPHRNRWRGERLDISESRSVRAPIRYGRRSHKRGNSYTMVFSAALARDESKLGDAIFVPCRQRVRQVEHLAEEAEYLWAAERNSSTSNGRISADWGCVALVLNPSRPIPHALRKDWTTRISREQGYGRLNHATDEDAIVAESGVLKIPWPQYTEGTPLEVDALLATATCPTLIDGRYPSAKQIADAWRTNEDRDDVRYFRKNKEHNISTFQDGEIEGYLNDEISP